MKAFLLAAGLGTRLKPLTDKMPKCLVPINNKPLLGWWIDLFEKHNINEVLINLHHFPEQVINFVASYPSDIKFNFYYEEILLGSGGTVRKNKSFVKDENDFLIVYADNLTNYDLTSLISFHRNSGKAFSMALFESINPTACGIALLDENNIVIDFEEKPEKPKSNLANAGIYIANPGILDLIPDYKTTDIGFHVLPKLVNKMAGWRTDDFLIDIGTPDNLIKAEQLWPAVHLDRKNVFIQR